MHMTLCISLSGMFVLTSCGFFTMREAEGPGDVDQGYLAPIFPSHVISNFELAMSNLSGTRYMECLSDSGWTTEYRFDPDFEESSLPEFDNWTRQEEDLFIRSLEEHFSQLPPDTQHDLNLSQVGDLEIFPGDSAMYVGNYEIFMEHGISGSPEYYSGTLHFRLSRSEITSDWAIHFQSDDPADSSAGFTRLKSDFWGR